MERITRNYPPDLREALVAEEVMVMMVPLVHPRISLLIFSEVAVVAGEEPVLLVEQEELLLHLSLIGVVVAVVVADLFLIFLFVVGVAAAEGEPLICFVGQRPMILHIRQMP
jgi:hypothetical protein